MWLDILALIGAIWLIVRVVVLRQVAALPFTRQAARFVDAAAPAAIADLVAQANAELDELGFEPARWVRVVDADGEQVRLRIVRLHRKCHAAVWLEAPTLFAPNRLLVWYVTRMLDGRTLITQPFDVYFQLLAREQALVQICGEASFAGQWAAHCALVATHGATDASGIEDAALLGFYSEWMERQRKALIAAGDLVPSSDSSARPSLGLAWRAVAAMRRMPKPPADPRPVPPARIALLATQHERMRGRSPARQVEWALFAVSVTLFMGLGAVLWNPMAAWMILVVVVIHELGHFLAMRAFGYRNVHMMALPLVGGVAIGQDVDPSAHRSAWMSLMGPLPGILIGWAIMGAVATDAWPAVLGDGSAWAMMFLLLNYLNVLPVPPLDGAHVVQALLPPRRAWIEVGFIGVACLLGAWAAWEFGFVLLTALALLQLFSLSARWQAQRALAAVAQQPPAPGMARPLRIRVVADALERLLGPTPHGKHRVELALDVMQRLDRKPMRGWQTLLVGGTLALLLVVPVGIAVVAWDLHGFGARQPAVSGDALESRRAQEAALRAAAGAMSDEQLIDGILESADWAGAPAAPADAEAIAAAEVRIGMSMPPPLRALYRRHDGLPALGIGPVADLAPAGAKVDEWFDLLEASEYPVDIHVPGAEQPGSAMMKAAVLRDWLLVGGDEESLLLFNPDPAGQPAQWVNLWAESPSGYRSLHEWLQDAWVSSQQQQSYLLEMQQRQQRAYARFASADWETVLDALQPETPILMRLIADAPDLPGPATTEDLAAAEQRLGRVLPADYRELLLRHDGHPMLGLDPVAQVHVLDAGELANNMWLQDLARPRRAQSTPGAQPVKLAAGDELVGCMALQADSEHLSTSIVLCPGGHPQAGVLDLRQLLRYPDVLSLARTRAAQVSVMRE
jgi:cell wall assembly regulator SMI1/Zn-dependent protease